MANLYGPVFDSEDLPGSIPENFRHPMKPTDRIEDETTVEEHDHAENYLNGLEYVAGDDSVDACVDNVDNGTAPLEMTEQVTSTNRPRANGSSAPNGRISGGVPPVRKKVTEDLDTDDEIIWEMKRKGYRDQPVRDYLVSQNRTTYDAKTIATRYSRIKKVKIAAQERKLEANFEDYLERDDDALRKAITKFGPRHQKVVSDAEARHWTAVAEEMNKLLPEPKWTKKLAKERWEGIQSGTAICPFEKDSNPVERTLRVQESLNYRRLLYEKELNRAQAETEKQQEIREKATKQKEQLKANRKTARENKRAAAKTAKASKEDKTEAAAEARREEDEKKAAAKIQQHMEREQRKKEISDKKAAAAWDKKLQIVELRQKKQTEKLERVAENARKKAEAIKDEVDKTMLKELIRRHMRLAGAPIAAPLSKAPSSTGTNLRSIADAASAKINAAGIQTTGAPGNDSPSGPPKKRIKVTGDAGASNACQESLETTDSMDLSID